MYKNLTKALKQLPLNASIMSSLEINKNMENSSKEGNIDKKSMEQSIRNKRHDSRHESLIHGLRSSEKNLYLRAGQQSMPYLTKEKCTEKIWVSETWDNF